MDLKDMDRKYIWHPFTQMKDYEKDDPLIIERGDRVYLIDVEGNRYIDGVSSLWVNIHGHCHPEINRAIHEQVDRISHSTLLGISNRPAVELAKRLIDVAPAGLTKVFYSDNGSTSVEIGIKMAYQFWQQKGFPEKKKFISLAEGYHGDTIGSVSLGGIDLFHKIYGPLLFKTIKAPSYSCYRCQLGLEYPSCELACAGEMDRLIEEHREELCAVVMEPLVQGAGGMLTAKPGYLRKVSEACRKHDILLLLDEVAVGVGRTGKFFACEHEMVSPDIMCIAKGITGGYLPLAVTMTTDWIYDAFLGEHTDYKTFFHGHTYTGNPVCCASAIANLSVFENERTLENLSGKIKFLENGLKKFWELEHVGDIRQCGFMVGIELVVDRSTKKKYRPGKRIGMKVIKEAKKGGVIIRPLSDVIVLMPPLSIQIKELKQLLEVTYDSIRNVTEGETYD